MSECIDKNIGKNLDRYLFDLLSEQDQELFERHILECDFCAEEAEKFSEASTHLLHSTEIKNEVAIMANDRDTQQSVKTGKLSDRQYVPWWRRRVVWAAAALIIILLVKPWKIEFAPSDEVLAGDNRIAILPINSPESDDNWLGDAATNLLNTNLSESDQLTILTTQHVENVLEYLDLQKIREFDADLALKIADKADANWVIIGRVNQTEPELSINVLLLNTVTGDTVANKYLTGRATDDLFSIIDKMSDTLKTNILHGHKIESSPIRSVADITTRSPEAYRYYLKGVSLENQLYNNEAESCFVKAISYDSTFAMAYFHLAQISDRDYIEKALKYIDKSSRREHYYIKAYSSLINRDTDGFFHEMDNLIKDFPYDARAYYWYARIKNSLGESQHALDYYYKAVEVDPYYKLAYNNMSYIFMDMGDYDKALWANDMYIAISPDEANPYDTRGDIYAAMSDFNKAIESYLKALEIKPFFEYTYSKLGVMFTLTRNFDQARYWEYTGWANEHDTPFPANYDALMYAAEGKFEKAIEVLDEGLKLTLQGKMEYVSIADIIQIKAQILAEKEPSLAVKEMEDRSSLVDSLPENQKLYYNLAYASLLARAGDFQRADSILKVLQQKLDTTVTSQYLYFMTAGYIDLQREHFEDAITLLKRAGELIPPKDDFDSRYLLAVAYIETGKFSEAISELTYQIKSQNFRRMYSPMRNAKMHYWLGRAYEGIKNYKLAIEQYEYFLEIWKEADWRIKEIDDAKNRLARLKNRTKS